ncbi:GH12635 [Drosophila grimshawi]|uniref:GH12635 n=1 Tax=Drosophila grimshawi TaxID=7222 RepID=B4JKC5_DROGR|nr:GH12635 [Drosophila grimshawi]
MADSCDDDDGDGDGDGAATDAFGGKYDPGNKYNYDNASEQHDDDDDDDDDDDGDDAACNLQRIKIYVP